LFKSVLWVFPINNLLIVNRALYIVN